MSQTVMTTNAPRVTVRFKRCPECGDVSLMSAPICTCCDRTFVTTARFARQSNYSTYIDLLSNLKPTPYLYDKPADFEIVGAKFLTKTDEPAQNPLAIAAAAIPGFAWVGMLINGQKTKGAVMLFVTLIWGLLAFMVARESNQFTLFTWASGAGLYLVMLVDVICIFNRRRINQEVGPWDWF